MLPYPVSPAPWRARLCPPGLLRLWLWIWLGIEVLVLLFQLKGVISQRFPDPDDALRLQQVRDLLAGQGWFDVHQYRLDPLDGGVLMHWSRLVDMPLAAGIWALRPFLGQGLAEQVTMVLVPMLTLGLVLWLVMRLAWLKLGRREAGLAGLMLAMAVPLLQQVQPRRIDHHGWQVVALLLAVNAMAARDGRRAGWLAGFAMAAGLTISLEELPMSVVLALVGVWRWLDGRDRFWLARYMGGLALGAAGLFLATRGLGDLVTHCDQVSPVHLAVFGFAALGLAGLALAERGRALPLWGRLGAMAVLGGGAAAIYASAAPQCRQGIFAQLPEPVYRYWYLLVSEGLPIWQQTFQVQVQVYVPAAFALYALVRLAGGTQGAARRSWLEYGVVLLGALAVAVLVQRAAASLVALALVPVSALVAGWIDMARTRPSGGQRMAALLAIVLAVEPGFVPTIYGLLHPTAWVPGSAAQAVPGRTVDSCHLQQSAQVLARLPRGNVLAPLDISPELLLVTPHAYVASGHHRGMRAMNDVIGAFMGSDAQAHSVVARRRIAYVALCPGLNEMAIYKPAAPDGFAAHLLSGHAPAWLVPVAGRGPLQVWRVVG